LPFHTRLSSDHDRSQDLPNLQALLSKGHRFAEAGPWLSLRPETSLVDKIVFIDPKTVDGNVSHSRVLYLDHSQEQHLDILVVVMPLAITAYWLSDEKTSRITYSTTLSRTETPAMSINAV
jgi:hypothetical protein